MVYVDELKASLRSKRWPYDKACHLFADTDQELHNFAARLGLRRGWFQAHKKLRHYDLTEGKRAQALRIGAKAVDMHFVAEFMRRETVEPTRLVKPFQKW